MSGGELAALAAALTEITTRYREEQKILPPIYPCRRCGTAARAKSPVIHVGNMIFAAKRLGLIDGTWHLTPSLEARVAASSAVRAVI